MYTKDGFHKALEQKLGDDAYLLLANGGHKKLTDLLTAASLTADGNNTKLSITVGGTTKTGSVTVPYASNADTVDSQHFKWSNDSNSPTYLWAANSSGTAFLCARGSMSVNYASSAGYASSATTATTATILLTNNTAQAADACYNESPGLRFWRYNGTSSTTGQGGGDGWIMSWSWNSGSVGGQIYVDDNPSKTICIRGRNNDANKTFTTWATILHSDNYTSYTVTKTGSGASGTWGINITGSAGSVAWGNVTSKPATATRWPTWDEVTGKPLSATSGNNGPTWGNFVPVKSDGVMEIGKYLDFHNSSNDGVDYAVRLQCQGNNQVIINLPTGAGTLARTADLTWGNVTSKPATATRWPTWAEVTSKPSSTGSGTQPVYWNGSTFVACTTYANASVNYANSAGNADTVDNEHASAFHRNLGGENYITITVNGNANTYYPVVIGSPSDYYPYQFVSITRNYAETAPDTWNTSTHRGGLSMALFWNGSRYWDGNGSGSEAFVVRLYESYCRMVGGVENCTNGKVVWLRGGGANYHIFSMNGRSQSATVYLSTYTDSASRSFAPKTTPDSITVRWPGYASGADYATSAGSVAWGNVTGKPSTFAPSSHTHSYLPLSGGTLTGSLNTASNLYRVNSTYGINMNNSDIVGCNCIAFGDLSDDYTEGILFYRDNGNWDSFRAKNGTFYFGVNNGTEYTAIHSGNIGSQSVNYATSAGSSGSTNQLANYGYGSTSLTYYQTDGSFDGSSGWCHYIICNHGNGSSYYHFTIGLPFWGIPKYRRQTGSTSDVSSWYSFITTENYTSYCASASHSHSYLPLSGGTLTGSLTISNGYDLNFKAASGSSDTGDLVFFSGSGTEIGRIWLNGSNFSVRYSGSDSAKTILHTGNYSSYALPLSGGTMSGTITCVANYYAANGKCGIDMNNSDILGCNSIRFGDLSDDYTEGLMFYRSNGNWDSIYAVDGTFYLAVNNGTLKDYANLGSSSANLKCVYTNLLHPGSSNNLWLTSDNNIYLSPGGSSTSGNNCVVVGSGYMHIRYSTNSTMTYGTTNPRLIFSENGTQAVGLVYCDWDAYRSTKGIKCMDVDNSDTGNVWFEVQGSCYAPSFYTTSDRTKKTNIEILSEHIRKFTLKETNKDAYGVIAQEVPEMFRDGEEGNMTVNYNSVLSYYVGLLENKVKNLEETNKKLLEFIEKTYGKII